MIVKYIKNYKYIYNFMYYFIFDINIYVEKKRGLRCKTTLL